MADEISDNSITSLVEYATQADFDKPDLAVALEIADRANQSKKEYIYISNFHQSLWTPLDAKRSLPLS